MHKYDAATKKQYIGWDNELITAKEKLAQCINDRWIYSMHWKEDTWVEQARKDLIKRQQECIEEQKMLSAAYEILQSIED